MLLPWLRAGLLLSLTALIACARFGDSTKPIPTLLIPARQKVERLVVVLPGRGDDLAALQRSGIVEAIQGAWPDADVILAELAMPYYTDRRAPHRLHNEIILPARQRGYRQIWLTGASLGGMGTLMYDRHYPGEIDGMVLLAPYLGDASFLEGIRRAGGLRDWNPTPANDDWQYDLWRHLQSWQRTPGRARNVWLVYGERDRLRDAMPLLEPLLRKQQILVRPGGHTWKVWAPAMREVLEQVPKATAE